MWRQAAAVALTAALAGPAGAGGTSRAPTTPVLATALDTARWRHLAISFAIAVRRVDRRPSCAALFTALGQDGSVALAGTTYSEASREDEARICRRHGGAAFTRVGSSETRLCYSFSRLAERRAAATLIHEALHFAGLSERPPDSGAMTSAEITFLVEEACNL